MFSQVIIKQKNTMSDSMQIPQKLRSAVLFNVANDLILSISIFFFPASFIAFSGWLALDPFALRLIAGGLTAVAIQMFLSRNATIESFKSILNIKVATMGFGLIGVVLTILQNSRPPIFAELILFGGLLLPFIQLGYWRMQLGILGKKSVVKS